MWILHCRFWRLLFFKTVLLIHHDTQFAYFILPNIILHKQPLLGAEVNVQIFKSDVDELGNVSSPSKRVPSHRLLLLSQEYWSGLPFPSPMHACMLSRFSRVRLCATPQMAAHQAPLSTGFSRQEYWSGLPSLLWCHRQWWSFPILIYSFVGLWSGKNKVVLLNHVLYSNHSDHQAWFQNLLVMRYSMWPMASESNVPKTALCYFILRVTWCFPGGSVVKNLPANEKDTSFIPDQGRSHMPQSE